MQTHTEKIESLSNAQLVLEKAKKLKRKVRRAPQGEWEFSRELFIKKHIEKTEPTLLNCTQAAKYVGLKFHTFLARQLKDNIEHIGGGRKKLFEKHVLDKYISENPLKFTRS